MRTIIRLRPTASLLASLLLILLAPHALSRQATSSPATTSPSDPRAQAIAPFLDGGTFLVAHADLSGVDLAAVETWTVEVANELADPDEDKQAIAGQVHQSMALAQGWVADLRKGGVREVYWLLGAADLPSSPGLLVLPLPAGADPKPIVQLFEARFGERAAVTMNGAVVFGEPSTIQRYQEEGFKPMARPALGAAFAAGGDSAAQLALIMPGAETVQEVAGRLFPPLATNPLLTDGIKWAVVSGDAPPQERLRLVVSTKDNASAQALQSVINMALASWQQMAARDGVDVTALVRALAPTLADNRLTLSKDAAAIAQDVTAMLPALRAARLSARRVVSMSNIRQQLQGIMMYANEHKDEVPDNLQAVAEYFGGGAERVFTNPLRPKANPGYIYIKPPVRLSRIKDPSARLMIYEAFEQWPGQVNVGFADGHVEPVKDEASFRALLQEAQGPTTAPTTREGTTDGE
jgi:prepilin-type processing-associated H-X9-DG protein